MPTPQKHSKVSWGHIARALFIALLLTPACVYWARSQGIDRIFSLMVPPVALTMLVAFVNVAVRRWFPRHALQSAEIILIYAQLAVACAMSSEWLDCYGPQAYGYAAYAPANPRHKEQILPFLSDWLFFKDTDQLKDFRDGNKSFAFFVSQLPMWWPKIGAWTLFITLLSVPMLCINALLREQWVHNEKLSFPLVQIPLALADPGGDHSVWRSKVLWGSLLVMFAIDMLNGFSVLFPSLPSVNVRTLINLDQVFPNTIIGQIGGIPLGIFPYMCAIGFFMPSDLLFSLLFFFFVRKGEQVIAFELGNAQGLFGGGGLMPSPPYFSEQSWGAFLGLFFSGMYLARDHWKKLGQAIFDGNSSGLRPDGLSYRFVFLLLVASLGGLGLFGVAIGLPFVWILLYVGLYLIFSLAVTRLRAQLGAPTHEMAFMGPHQLILDSQGTTGWNQAVLTRTMTAFFMINRIHRTDPQPTFLESQYLAERVGVSQRVMFGAIFAAIVIGTVCGNLSQIYLGYHLTPSSSPSDETGNLLRQILQTPRSPNVSGLGGIAAGIAVVFGLDWIRFRFPGFWLHPAGYALAMNFGVDYYWFGLLIVLITKVFVQRYFGLKGSEKLKQAAIGIIVGEYAAEFIWATYSMLHNDQITYSISINGKMD